MKRRLYTIGIVALIAASCQSDEAALRKTAEGYIQAMADYRIEDARQYATPETSRSTIDFVLNVIMPNLDSSYIEKNTPAEITIKRIEHLSDTSAVVHFEKTTPIQQGTKATLEMRLRDGRWIAHQEIRPRGIFGGNLGGLDTAAMRQMRTENPDSLPMRVPLRKVPLGKDKVAQDMPANDKR